MPKRGAVTIEAIILTVTSITVRIITGTLVGEPTATPAENSAYAE
jgi:hypothetical protein